MGEIFINMPFVSDISTDFSGTESVSETESDLSDFNSYTTAQSGTAGETDGSLMRIIKSKSVRNTPKSSKSRESRGSRDSFTKMLQNANYEDNENNNIEENRRKRQMSNLEIFEVFKQNSLSEINDRIKIIPEVSGQLAQTFYLDKIFALLLPVIFIPILFGSIFVLTYQISDFFDEYFHPDTEIDELHFYLTSTREDVRYPRRPEVIASLCSIILTPIFCQYINKLL